MRIQSSKMEFAIITFLIGVYFLFEFFSEGLSHALFKVGFLSVFFYSWYSSALFFDDLFLHGRIKVFEKTSVFFVVSIILNVLFLLFFSNDIFKVATYLSFGYVFGFLMSIFSLLDRRR